jgi:hypothetical protein
MTMAQVHLRGVRYGIREPAMISSLQVWAGLTTVEAKSIIARLVSGERFPVFIDDHDAAYSLATELVELGVNAEADESDY